MKVLHFIGADLSKGSIDLAVNDSNQHLKVANGPSGFKQMVKWLKSQKIDPFSVMIVMEHTGLYSYWLEAFLHKKGIAFCKVPALAIKRSLGMIRGKTDKVDARRIARYGFEKADQLRPSLPVDEKLQQLKMLQSTRDSLVRHRASMLCSLKEYKPIVKASDPVITCRQKVIQEFTRQIEKLELQIAKITESAEELKKTSSLLQSIVGVGPVLSTATIIKTGNFTLFKSARKFACYCGSAPFEHSSGKSIKARTRVSHLADKHMKTLLDQSAKSALQYDPEIKLYYQSRIEKGNSKKSTINIIRNKIIYRMFAVVNRQTPYVKYKPAV